MLSTLFSLGSTSLDVDDSSLTQYAAALSASAPTELKALERWCRALNLYVNLGDTEGQVQACDALHAICKMDGAASAASAPGTLLARACLDQGTLPSVCVVLHSQREEPCRAAAALLADLCVAGADLRKAVVRSGVLRPLISILRKASEPRLLREGARVLAALASEPSATAALLREGAPRALKHLCRSKAVQCHALAVHALGRLARSDTSLLESDGLARVVCAVASSSVLDARAAAAMELRLLMLVPTRRGAMLDAGAVKVLLRSCDALNEPLRLAALHALAFLLTGAGLPAEDAETATPEDLHAAALAAESAREAAAAQFHALGGLEALVQLVEEMHAPNISSRALQLIEFLSRSPHPALDHARLVPLLVSLTRGGGSHATLTGAGDGGGDGGHPPRSSPKVGKGGRGGSQRASGENREHQPPHPVSSSSPSRRPHKGGGHRAPPAYHTSVGEGGDGPNPGFPPVSRLEAMTREVAKEATGTMETLGKVLHQLVDDVPGVRHLRPKHRHRKGHPGDLGEQNLRLGKHDAALPTHALTTTTSSSGHPAASGPGAASTAARPFLELGGPATYEPWPCPDGSQRLVVARTIANLLVSPAAQLAFINAQGIRPLLSLAEQKPISSAGDARGGGGGGGGGGRNLRESEVRREVVRCVARLSSSPVHAPALHRAGALPVLLAMLTVSQSENDEIALRHAACALGTLSSLPEVQIEISRLQAVPDLVKLSRSRDADTQRHAARAIGHLAGNAQCQREIGAAGGLRPLIKCGYSRSPELQQLVVRAVANLALEPDLNKMVELEGGHQLLLTLARSKVPEVVHWSHVAQGNLEAASALGSLVKHCPSDNPVEPVDMLTMSALVGHLRQGDGRVSLAVRRLTAAAVANLLVSAHNQRLLLECNGVKPLVALAHEALEPELQAQCMRAIANLAVTPDYRANLLQARTLPLIVQTLKAAQMHSGGTHTFIVLTHSVRALGNMCAGGDVAAAMQQKAAAEGAVSVLLPLLTKAKEHLSDLRKAHVVGDRVSGVDALLRETARTLSKLAQLTANRRPMVESDVLHSVIAMLSTEADTTDNAVSLGVKEECLALLGQLADVPECLSSLVSDGALQSLISLLHLPDMNIETAAAELLARLAAVSQYQSQISPDTIPLLVNLLHSASPATQRAGLHALNELLFERRSNQIAALKAGAVEPCIRLARLEDDVINSHAATLLCQMVLADAEDSAGRGGGGGGRTQEAQAAPLFTKHSGSLRLPPEQRLDMLAAMAMSANVEAHAVASMGLATMTNASDANTPLIAKVALTALVRLGRSTAPNTQVAALDALSVLAEYPETQVDLVRIGALRTLLERASTPGRDNADIRSLALTTVQHLASNGANMSALRTADVRNRLQGLTQTLYDEPAVLQAVDAIQRSIQTISALLELQAKQRLLRKGDVTAMADCTSAAGVEASISREVGHTCAAIGSQRGNVELFIAEGGIELLNSLARARSTAVQVECAQALSAFCHWRDAHAALHKHGGLVSLVHLARSHNPDLQRHVANAFCVLAEQQGPKTYIIQAGAVPFLFAFIRSTDPEIRYLAARAVLYLR